uniref:Uncharacterized protein n=1 Tax=Arundo donax TaxID=35708 RepID=A0A0A9FZP3_ARUDO
MKKWDRIQASPNFQDPFAEERSRTPKTKGEIFGGRSSGNGLRTSEGAIEKEAAVREGSRIEGGGRN